MDPYCRAATRTGGNSKTADQAFDWGPDTFHMPNWNEMVIYELHVGTFNAEPGRVGTFEDAIGRLQNAVSADPVFARAYTNLAACEASLKHFDKAAEYARKAVQLDPGLPAAQMNLSHILLVLREYSGAEAAARAALRLEGESGKARLFLGLALRGEGRLDEALENFTRAADSVPAARLYAADLLARTGNKVGAAGQLRAYLGSPGVENRAAIEHWLTRLAN
jgi:tetratricopeptide (TPR) repeat protein